MKTYVTDKAILIAEGNYTYEVLKGKDDQELQEKARQWLKTYKNAISAINEGDVINHIWVVVDRTMPKIEPSDRLLLMEPGDQALVVRKCPASYIQNAKRNPGEPTPRVREWEYGILKRIS
jgi:hypothetical protein